MIDDQTLYRPVQVFQGTPFQINKKMLQCLHSAMETQDLDTAWETFYHDDTAVLGGFERTYSHLVSLMRSLYQTDNRYQDQKLETIIEEVKKLKENQATIIQLHTLVTKRLRSPIEVLLEPDGDGFIARSVDVPVFGYGDDRVEAVDAFKHELESLYFDLTEDDEFTDDWHAIRDYLVDQVI